MPPSFLIHLPDFNSVLLFDNEHLSSHLFFSQARQTYTVLTAQVSGRDGRAHPWAGTEGNAMDGMKWDGMEWNG